ncbi:cytochrome b [Hyphomicrobium sulfonivorans]|nr:cytochrome b [Hyphomicrobium sulfonivorans]
MTAGGEANGMMIRDTSAGYGVPTRVLHWGMAVAILGMYWLGLWMVDLTYYSPYYQLAPDIHRSIGIILLTLLLGRFLWRIVNDKPDDSDLSKMERTAARVVHWGFYPLLLALMISGYLMSTADGRAIEVFDWFSVPAIIENKGMEKPAGAAHALLAHLTILLVIVHALAALKHQFYDRSGVLGRMWSGSSSNR